MAPIITLFKAGIRFDNRKRPDIKHQNNYNSCLWKKSVCNRNRRDSDSEDFDDLNHCKEQARQCMSNTQWFHGPGKNVVQVSTF